MLAGITQPGTYNVTAPTTNVMATSLFLPETKKNLSAKKVAATQNGTVAGSFVTEDAACKPTPTPVQSRTVTFTTFDSSKSWVGSYDVILASGDKLSGTFNAANCSMPAATTAAPTCGN